MEQYRLEPSLSVMKDNVLMRIALLSTTEEEAGIQLVKLGV